MLHPMILPSRMCRLCSKGLNELTRYYKGVDEYSSSRGSAQKHFHTDAPTGRRCESAFALLSHRESNKEVLPPCRGYGKMGLVRGLDDRKGG